MSRKEDIRRRTGCLQCKEKHLRCTEEQPRCRRCETLGLPCKRGLKLTFREDAIQRGLAFGREGLWTKRPSSKTQKSAVFRPIPLNPYINRWIFLDVAIDDFQGRQQATEAGLESDNLSEHKFLPTTSFLIPSYLIHPLHAFPESDAYLLDYFIQGISPSCSLSPSHNPYISLVIPLSFSSNTLRSALLAVAANQLCLLGRPELRQEACYYKDKALQGLRRQIAVKSHDEETVATVLMLCFQDISDGCAPSWLTHLRGGMQLLDCDGSIYRASPSLWGFFRMYFVAHDIMSRTATDAWDDDIDHSSQLWAEGDDLDEIDVLMGCSRSLMTLIHRISTLASAKNKILQNRPLAAFEAEYYSTAATELHQALITLHQTLPAHSPDRGDLKQIAHIKCLAAQLYLIERLGSPSTTPQHNMLQHHSQTAFHYPSKAVLIKSLIASITALTDQSTSATTNKPNGQNTNLATLLWPLFILGNASLENEEHRRFVLDRLLGIQKARNLGSVRRTVEAVKYIFGMGGLSLDLGSSAGNGGVGGRGREGVGWGCERWKGISLA